MWDRSVVGRKLPPSYRAKEGINDKGAKYENGKGKMSAAWFYMLLPVLSVTVCLFFLKNFFGKKANNECLLLIIHLICINGIQVLLYLTWSYSSVLTGYIADIYLITAYFFFVQLVLFSMSLSGKPISSLFRRLLYVVPVIFTVLHLMGLMVEGYRIEGYVIYHNDGVLAWCFDLFVIASCVATAILLRKNKKESPNDGVDASKSIIAPISFLPLIVVFITLVVLSRTEYVIPVVVVVPLISIYAAITFYYLQRNSVADLSFGVRFFFERLWLANKLLEMESSKSELRSYKKEVERLFILEVLEKHHGNIQETADYLEMNHTTVRNKIKEYEIVQAEKKGQKHNEVSN